MPTNSPIGTRRAKCFWRARAPDQIVFMDPLIQQIYTLRKNDAALSEDDIAECLGITPASVRAALGAPSAEDIPALLAASKQIAFDGSVPARTRQGCIEWLVDELKGRNDAKVKASQLNAMATIQVLAALESAQHAIPESVRRRQIIVSAPTNDI